MSSGNVLETRNLTKRFGDVTALRGVDFSVGTNEIVGLVGDNGAGKSTLMKIITGTYAPDDGEISIKGTTFSRLTPRKARELGIEMVHQERTLAENQPVWRNIFAGREIVGPLGFLKPSEMKTATDRVLEEVGFKPGTFSADRLARTFSGGYKQGIQISRVLYFRADLVILDEPTIQLSVGEAQRVLQFVKDLKAKGKSCVFISHNIYHVHPVADRIVIIDRGRIVSEFKKADVTIEDLSRILVTVAESGAVLEEPSRR